MKEVKTIKAVSENGKEYEYEVEISQRDYGEVVSLGFPMQWYIKDIETPPRGWTDKFYIDAGGRNHDGSSVWISWQELQDIISDLRNDNEL